MSYKGFQIKQATDNHIQRFIDYRELAFSETQDASFMTDRVATAELFKQHRVKSRQGILLFNEEGKIIGEMFVTSINSSGAASIAKLYVLESYRKKGAGTFLVRVMERLIAIGKCRVVCIHKSERTIGFFYKLGYRPVAVRNVGDLLVKDISSLLKTKCSSVEELLVELEKTY